jgi:hypothetical protein
MWEGGVDIGTVIWEGEDGEIIDRGPDKVSTHQGTRNAG